MIIYVHFTFALKDHGIFDINGRHSSDMFNFCFMVVPEIIKSQAVFFLI